MLLPREGGQLRKVFRDDRYFGETKNTHDAWTPYGQGESIAGGRRFFVGSFGRDGRREGLGRWDFAESSFSGLFRAGEMHGPGMLVEGDREPEPVLMWRGRVMCRLSGERAVTSSVIR